MSEAVIVVIPKPGKDPTDAPPIALFSLLNTHTKFLSKILAYQLNTVIKALVPSDQTGFMPGKGADINVRRLHTHMAMAV